ncbi:MAG: hypothetical protein IKI31_07425, partial [Treponema sp.]|nr:hypothetical protein [Treponema sp.]
MKRFSFFTLCVLFFIGNVFFAFQAFANDAIANDANDENAVLEGAENANVKDVISYTGSPSYFLTERTDLRRYDNGKYIGLTSREVKAYIAAEKNTLQNVYNYDGNFYVLEKTVRSLKNVAPSFNDAIPSVFQITNEGELLMQVDNGYPSFRSFPFFPKTKIKIGQSWERWACRTVDPLQKGVFTRIPMYVRYTYVADEKRGDEDVYL